jgi:hypothetical protein
VKRPNVVARTYGLRRPAHTERTDTSLQAAMKHVLTKSLVILVVAIATVRSYATLAMQTRVLPQHTA